VPRKSSKNSASGLRQPAAPSNFRTRYGGDVVLRFNLTTLDEAEALSEAADILYLDIWEMTENWMDIRVAKDVVPSFLGLLPPSLHNAYTPLMHDLAQAVYDTYPSSSPAEDRPIWSRLTTAPVSTSDVNAPHDLFFRDYQPLSVIYPWLRMMAALYPDYTSLTSIGLSAEGRDIPALRIGTPADSDSDDTRDTLLLVGGAHAREWISVSTSCYVAYSLLTKYGHPRFPYVTELLDHFDLVFIPILNPDGYDYTWTDDRLWRKNRQSTSLPFCPGIDLDRAFRFAWDGDHSTDNACSDDYAGTGPLSAVEARRLTDWARAETENNNVSFVGYLDFHSYSQQILYPYSYTCVLRPPNLEDLEEVGLGLAKSFRLTYGRYYGVSSACDSSIARQDKEDKRKKKKRAIGPLEPQGGSPLDFFHHDLGVKLAFQIKLRDTGTYGFLLPKSEIQPTGNEAFEAVLGLGKWLLGDHGIESVDAPDGRGSTPRNMRTSSTSPSTETTPIVVEGEGGQGGRHDDAFDFEELRRRRRR